MDPELVIRGVKIPDQAGKPAADSVSTVGDSRRQDATTHLEQSNQRAMERCGPTLLRTVAIIIVITNCTPSTAITRQPLRTLGLITYFGFRKIFIQLFRDIDI